MSAVDLLDRLRLAGVDLWADGERLQYSAPADALTDDLLLDLRRHKPEILQLLGVPAPASRRGEIPLSHMQESFWLLEKLYPGYTGANEQFAIRLSGELDAAALAGSWRDLVARHDSLRTTFGERDGVAFQRVGTGIAAQFAIADLQSAGDAADAHLGTLAREAIGTPFDLAEGPLLRPMLVRYAPQSHLLLVTAHHIVADGLCVPLIRDELAACYAARIRGRPGTLPAAVLQFPDVAARERATQSRARHAASVACSQARLTGTPGHHALPIRPPGSAPDPGPARRIAFEIDAATATALRQLARRENATPFTLLLAAFRLLLARFGAGDDLAIACPVTLRDAPETRTVIGCMVNTVLFRTPLNGDQTFLGLLAAERATLLQALEHRGAPLARIVEALQPARRRGAQPLSQILFQFDTASPPRHAAALEFRIEPVHVDRASYWDLEWSVTDHGGDRPLTGHLCFLENKFDEWFIGQLPACYVALLRGIVAAPDSSISRLPILDGAKRELLLSGWNATAADYPAEQTLHGLVEDQAKRNPGAIAARFGADTLSYGELQRRSALLARHLQSCGVRPGHFVGLALPPSFELIVSLLAILRAGAAYVPLDPDYPPARLQFMLADSAARVLVTASTVLPGLVPGGVERLHVDQFSWSEGVAPATGVAPANDPDRAAYLLYTSGSSGEPKGAIGLHRGAVNRCHWMWREYGFTESDVFSLRTSVGFVDSVWEIFGALIHGIPVAILPAHAARDAAALITELERSGATQLVLVPSLLRALLESEPDIAHRLRKLRVVISSGEPLEPDLWRSVRRRWPGLRLLNTYGTSEIWDASCCDTSTLPEAPSRIPIGRPIANVRVYVLDRHLQPVPAGVSGELCVGGVGVGAGYWQRPDLSAAHFLPDPFDPRPGARLLYRTGDLARWLPDGSLECLGRIDSQVKIRGLRVEIGEIESTLQRHPGVDRAAVAIREDPRGEACLVAWLVGDADPDRLRSTIADILPDAMRPAAYVRLDRLPLTPSGKVDRRALPAPDWTPAAESTDPRCSDTEKRVAAIWAEVLQVPVIGRGGDFFALGGHSLLAMRLVARINAAFGRRLTLRDLFDAPTVAGLAQRIAAGTVEEDLGGRSHSGGSAATCSSKPLWAPLSWGQERLWFLEQLDPASPAYNIAWSMRLSGALDPELLGRAFALLAERHASLRTTFVTEQGRPRARVAPRVDIVVGAMELTGAPAGTLERRRRELAREPFDIAAGPLLRATLLRIGADLWDLVIVIHHMITDGTSNAILFRELADIYGTLAGHHRPALPELLATYADFANWQRDPRHAERQRISLDYWIDRLRDAPQALELPADHPRPAEQKFRGAWIWETVPEALTAQLRRLARQERATLFMLMLAAFKVLLQRCSGQSDLVVGTPVSERPRPEFENLVGLFVNTAPLRTTLHAEMSFTDLLQRVRSTVIDALAHQEVPFERVVDALRPARTLARAPVFQVMFNLVPVPRQALHAGAVEFRLGRLLDHGVSTFDLSLTVGEAAAGLDLIFEYDTDLFDPATVQSWARSYLTLLSDIVARPATAIPALRLVSTAEHRRQRRLLAGPAAYAQPRETIPQLFALQVAASPDACALIAGAARATYRELDQRAEHIARILSLRGVTRGDRVAVCLPRSRDLIAAILAVLRAGAAYVPLDPDHPPARLQYMLDDSAATLLITDDGLAQPFAWTGGATIRVGEMTAAPVPAITPAPPAAATAQDIAYLIYTSGTTGRAKGVAVSHANLVSAFRAWKLDYRLSPADTHLQMAGPAFDVFAGDWIRTLLSGGCLVLCPRETLLQPERLFAALRDHAVTVAEFVPAVMRPLMSWLEESGRSLDFMRLVIVGSDIWYPAEHRRLARLGGAATRVVNSYGVAEATIDSTFFEGSAELAGGAAPLIGRPFANTALVILDDYLQPVPPGVAGELCIGGAGVAAGYQGEGQLTAARFIDDPQRGGARLYRSGDRVRLRGDGMLEYLGRLDRQLKVRGLRIEPGEIESVLAEEATVAACVVALCTVAAGDERLVAYVVVRPGAPFDGPALRGWLQRRLPDYMIPAAFMALAALPLNANGKVERGALPAPQWGAAGGASPVAARSAVEELLCGLFAEVLQIRGAVGIDQDFFALGGHSLLATQLVSRIRAVLEVELPLRVLFEGPTVAALAAALPDHRQGATVRAAALPAAGFTPRAPLSYPQQRLWFLEQLQPGNAAYNLHAAYRLSGIAASGALRQALQGLVARHEALRTTFAAPDGEPEQRIAASQAVALDIEEARGLDERALQRRLQALAEAPFDLARGPLWRVHLLQLGGSQQLLLVVMHHIIADGWSLSVLLRELALLYNAYRRGHALQLPALPIGYADYARWQRSWLQGAELQRQLQYWRGQLAGAPPLLHLPADRPRPAAQTYKGAWHVQELSPQLTARLIDLARAERCTLFMVLLAAFEVVLMRYSGAEELVIGTPVAGRQRRELEGLIGFFINTLVLRTDLSGDPRFSELLARVKRAALGAYSHADVPFERLVEILQPERSRAWSPVTQVLFTLHNEPRSGLDLDGVRADPEIISSRFAKFDLSVHVAGHADALLLSFNYNTDLYDEATVAGLAESYARVLAQVTRAPQVRIGTLELTAGLSAAPAAAVVAAGPEPGTLLTQFAAAVERAPESVALQWQQGQWRYRELAGRVAGVAQALRATGVQPHGRIGVLLGHDGPMVAGLLGVLAAGQAYVPLERYAPARRNSELLRDAQAQAILTEAAALAAAPWLRASGVPVVLLEDCGSAPAEFAPLQPEQLAYILYTSGSSGTPKGVPQTHAHVLAHVGTWRRQLQLGAADRLSLLSSYGFDAAVQDVFGALLSGAALHPLDLRGGLSAAQLVDRIAAQRLTVLHATPTVYRHLFGGRVSCEQGEERSYERPHMDVRAGASSSDEIEAGMPARLSSVRLVVLGGEAARRADLELFKVRFRRGARLVNGYGLTECTMALQFCADHDTRVLGEGLPIGVPVGELGIRLLDADGEPHPWHGELELSSAQLTPGYLHDERNARFGVAAQGRRSFRTGDRVRRLPDGQLLHCGRLDRQLKLRGIRIEPAEIEAVLQSHPLARDAAVVVRTGERGEPELVALTGGGRDADSSVLFKYLRERLPAYMVPAVFIAAPELPRLANGKLDRHGLARLTDRADGGRTGARPVAPRTGIEERLAKIWCEVLKRERIGVYDDFFALGGHSLLATRVISRLRDLLGRDVPLLMIFAHPTVAAFAAALDREAAAGDRPGVPVATALPPIRTRERKSNMRGAPDSELEPS